MATADLSREGKAHNAAAQAIADFESSRTLARAREAVELAVAKHDIKPEARDATLKAMNQAEQGWQRAIDKIGERASLAKSPITRR
jgi:lipopolysaccharide biosynthesis regulator YciM